MKKTTHIIDDMEVEIVLETPTEIVASPIEGNEGERLFLKNEEIQERPGKDQGRTSKRPMRDQAGTSKRPLCLTVKSTKKTTMLQAREKLPEPMHLLDEVQEKWFLIDALQADVYSHEHANGFTDLCAQIKGGKIKVCPRPIMSNVNKALRIKVSRNQITRAISLYIRYTEEYRESTVWTVFFRLLGRFDRTLDRMLDF